MQARVWKEHLHNTTRTPKPQIADLIMVLEEKDSKGCLQKVPTSTNTISFMTEIPSVDFGGMTAWHDAYKALLKNYKQAMCC